QQATESGENDQAAPGSGEVLDRLHHQPEHEGKAQGGGQGVGLVEDEPVQNDFSQPHGHANENQGKEAGGEEMDGEELPEGIAENPGGGSDGEAGAGKEARGQDDLDGVGAKDLFGLEDAFLLQDPAKGATPQQGESADAANGVDGHVAGVDAQEHGEP